MQRSETRILTTHVGSLIRPKELLDLTGTPVEGGQVSRVSRGGDANLQPDSPEYRAALSTSVKEVVKHQAQAGVDVVSDGEFGKSSWAAYVLERITGFQKQPDRLSPLTWLGSDRERFKEFWEVEMPAALTGVPADVVVGPITYVGHAAMQRDIDNFKAALADANVTEGFLPVAAPASVGYNSYNDYYKTDEELAFAIGEALREEYLAITNAGLLLQIDDAVLTHMHEEPNYREWAQHRIDATNHALRGIPPEKVRYHICFGSWHVPHVADAPLSKIIDLVLQVNAGAYSIEAANPRHEWEWTVWQNTRLPQGKLLLPGVITHHTNVVEHPELIAQRIERFANLVGRENVIASSDCGFAQAAGVRRVHPSIMWAKLEAQAEGARIATRRLWG